VNAIDKFEKLHIYAFETI